MLGFLPNFWSTRIRCTPGLCFGFFVKSLYNGTQNIIFRMSWEKRGDILRFGIIAERQNNAW